MAIPIDSTTGAGSSTAPGKVIKFDIATDSQMRRNAKIAHDLSKQLREVKIEFIRLVPIIKDAGLMRKFSIKKNTKDLELLVSLTGNKTKDQLIIDDILAFFLVREDFVISHHGIYTEGAQPLYFFIITPMNVTIDEKEEKENMIREHSQQ